MSKTLSVWAENKATKGKTFSTRHEVLVSIKRNEASASFPKVTDYFPLKLKRTSHVFHNFMDGNLYWIWNLRAETRSGSNLSKPDAFTCTACVSLKLTDFILPLKTSKKNLSISHPTVIFVPGISEISETWAKSLDFFFFLPEERIREKWLFGQ